MSLPLVFFNAGSVPTIACIICVSLASSLTGTLFAQALAEIPGNRDYSLNVEYSNAFEIVIGRQFYVFAESLFVTACLIQCTTGIVQAAQSLDSFFASYLLGQTYALQLIPSIEFISWSEDSCVKGASIGALAKCVPFLEDGSLVLTLGFAVVTLIFLPLGMQNLKETIIVQLFSFCFLCAIMLRFHAEFIEQGLTETVPLIGHDFSQLIGVVLFNFAYIITLPSWLIEKKTTVNPNSVIWCTTTFCSFLYITFGLFAALCFGANTTKMIALLASNEVYIFTLSRQYSLLTSRSHCLLVGGQRCLG